MTREEVLSMIDGFKEEIERSSDSGVAGFNWYLTTDEAKMIVRYLDMIEKNSDCSMSELCRLTTEARTSPYRATVEGMLSPDYKERFKAEYQQTKIRYEKLNAFCNRIEAAMRTCPGDTKRVQMPEHDCPLDLLHDQLRAMGEYLHFLEIRAVIEGIALE